MKARVLVITGYGLNCEGETSFALERAGASVDRVHLHDLLEAPGQLGGYGLLVVMGGFSYGDHLGAGRALAIRLRYGLAEELADFVGGGGRVMGICNGFQVLCKLGLLPGFEPFRPGAAQTVTLTHNDSGVFRDDWVRLKVNENSPCLFTRGLDVIELPVRHGEGKFMTADAATLARLREGGQIVYQYCDEAGRPTQAFPANPNGSVEAVAGICDATGRIFGTMPHPEAFIFEEHHPQAARLRALGLAAAAPVGMRIMANAVAGLAGVG